MNGVSKFVVKKKGLIVALVLLLTVVLPGSFFR